MLDSLPPAVSYAVAAAIAVAAAVAGAHAALTKRDVRAAIGWVGLVVVFPLAGPLLYALFGINRIRRRASGLRTGSARGDGPPDGACCPGVPDHLRPLERLVGRMVGAPLLAGNRVEPLVDGEEAYPPMLAAIDDAARTVALSTYIFDNDAAGKRFQGALAEAVARGVEVRVIVDAVGARYSFPPVPGRLRRAGVPTAVFLPTLIPWRMPYVNLRTHRKVLVADGRTAFVGGMNLRDEHLVRGGTTHPVQDLHFRVEGPVVAQVQRLFAGDWELATGERLAGEGWFPALADRGAVAARVVPDGPDEDMDKLRWTLLGALAIARRSVRVVTPYFLPDTDLVTALSTAALRGVEVDVVLPEENNLTLVGWAMRAQLPQVIEHGCRVWLSRPPFDHSKLVVVDGAWSLVGSANWDPRSLRLNFEIALEAYDEALAARLERIFAGKLEGARRVTPEWLAGRGLPVRLRDAAAWLAQPYL